MYGSCEDNPGYDSEYLDAPDEPEEAPEEEPMMTNEFLQPTINFLREMVACKVRPAQFQKAIDMLLAIPELQGSCGVCLREDDHIENGHYVSTDPIAVVRCSNGCRGCDKCVKPCEDGACSVALCSDCSELCEGCGERFCKDHIIRDPKSTDIWCAECVPAKVEFERDRELAFIED